MRRRLRNRAGSSVCEAALHPVHARAPRAEAVNQRRDTAPEAGGRVAHRRRAAHAEPTQQRQRADARRSLLEDGLVHARQARQEGLERGHDRRLADIQWYLGVAHLELRRPADALGHYRRAAATLRLRHAILARSAHDRDIARLTCEAAAAGTPPTADADAAHADAAHADAAHEEQELAQLKELLADMDERIGQVQRVLQVAS